MSKRSHKMLYVFLFMSILDLSMADSIYAANSDHINLSRETLTEEDNEDEILNNNNSWIIFIRRSATISLTENSAIIGDHPIFRISYNELGDGDDRNSERFFMRHNSRITFGDDGLIETRIILRNNITSHGNNNTIVFRRSPVVIESGINVIETNRINMVSSEVTLIVSINDERSAMGGLVGIRDNCNPYLNPIFYITGNSTLNVVVDENSVPNMVRGRAYRVISGFNNIVGRERIVLSPDNSRFGIRGHFEGNDYFVSIGDDYVPTIQNNTNVIPTSQNNNLFNNIGTSSISGF